MGNATPQDQWEEYLAMYIVEDLLPYGKFKKSECPDLHGTNVGIEVIRARPKTYEERRSYIRRALRDSGLGRMSAKRYSNIVIREADARLIDKTLLLSALRKKEVKLNKGHYKMFEKQGLFVFSLVTSFNEAPHGEALKWALYEEVQAVMNLYERKYDFILVYSEPCGEIYWLDFTEGFIKTEKVERLKYEPALAALSTKKGIS